MEDACNKTEDLSSEACNSSLTLSKDTQNSTVEGFVKLVNADGFSWRKYGQKDILGSNYPRSYYRCFFRMTHGCLATKQMQVSDDGNTFDVKYRGTHTCCSVAKNTPASSSEATESVSYGAASNETSETYFKGVNSSYSIQNWIKESNLMQSTFTTNSDVTIYQYFDVF